MADGYKFKKQSIKFETQEEKEIHRFISSMRYGEVRVVNVDGTNPEDKKRITKAIKKSAAYNNMDIQIRWSDDLKSIRITQEM